MHEQQYSASGVQVSIAYNRIWDLEVGYSYPHVAEKNMERMRDIVIIGACIQYVEPPVPLQEAGRRKKKKQKKKKNKKKKKKKKKKKNVRHDANLNYKGWL